MATEDVVIHLTSKLDQYFQAATEVITKYGDEAVSMGLLVLRIEAAEGLIGGLVGLLVVYLFTKKWFFLSFFEKARKAPYSEEFLYRLAGIASALAFIIGVCLSLFKLLNIWNWIGLFWPEVYAVHKYLL